MARNKEPAIIYVAVRDDDAIKIGFTRNLAQRSKTLARIFPGTEIIDTHTMSGEIVREIELHAHGLVWDYRTHGEWFCISPLEARCAIISASRAVSDGLPLPLAIRQHRGRAAA